MEHFTQLCKDQQYSDEQGAVKQIQEILRLSAVIYTHACLCIYRPLRTYTVLAYITTLAIKEKIYMRAKVFTEHFTNALSFNKPEYKHQ